MSNIEQELQKYKVKAKFWEEEAARLREELHKRDMQCVESIKDSLSRMEEMLGTTE